nr:polysaccharide biosynthesis/export family protein [Neokomagataea anthophila]
MKILASTMLPIALGACAFMPSAGPHASLLLDKTENSLPVVDVTEAISSQLWQETILTQKKALDDTLSTLKYSSVVPLKISTGDVLSLTLWVAAGQSDVVLGNVPQPRDMGHYTVSMDGTVNLPYVGKVYVRGMLPQKAEKIIAERFGKTELFPQPEATIQIAENKAQNIVVMGAVNAPTVLNWSEGGMDISEAIARAGGFRVFDPSRQGSDLSVNNILLIREGKSFQLPMKAALSQAIPLQAGDRIVLQHTPVVKALCLGAGWKSPTTVPFDELPTLSEVLSGAGDMNLNSAQGRAIFIFKNDTRVIYRINFDKPEGMRAAQTFPVNNKDMVYIPPSRSVTLQQVVNIIMSVGYPAAMGAALK